MSEVQAVATERRLVVGWPPYLRVLTAGLREVGLQYAVLATAPDKRTLVYSATPEDEARLRALVMPSILSLRGEG